jgi:hypothetical protein
MADFAPTHPGEILMTEVLEPMGITQYRIAKAIDVPARPERSERVPRISPDSPKPCDVRVAGNRARPAKPRYSTLSLSPFTGKGQRRWLPSTLH